MNESTQNLVVASTDGDLLTTSLAVADGTQNDHKAVIQLVRTYVEDLSDFGRVAFEMRPFETAGGAQQREIALLNEPQATLLLTYMRNSEIVRTFKKRLVKEFWAMRQRSQFDPSTLTRSDILKLALQSEQERLEAIAQRDKAIATKAEIGSRREATAMAKASAAVREVNTLKIRLSIENSHATVRAVEKALRQKFDWKPLDTWCKVNDPEKRHAVDPLYGRVRTWPAGAWFDVFGVDIAAVLGVSQ